MNKILQFLSARDFLVAFISNSISGLLVLLLGAILTYQFTLLFKKPKLSMVVKQGKEYSDSVLLTEDGSGNYEASFRLAIKNSGRGTLGINEGYWHAYFPNPEKIESDEHSQLLLASYEPSHSRDLITAPIYPDSFLDIGPEYKVQIKKENYSKAQLRYFFETTYGFFPSTVKRDQRTGLVPHDSMGEIKLKLKQQIADKDR